LLVAQADQPTEIFTFDDGNLAPLTNVNGDLLDGVARAEVEKLRFESADGTPVEAFFVRPVNFDASVRYPTILWLHGGPVPRSFRIATLKSRNCSLPTDTP
jgi:dipeptidyl aminopeptidase/acylaminoacyl peptidase